ncbi:EAL domain-containing protein [Asticcacaulis sp. EMRT-3]|uniref:putative bifunctional diguanylate cyclase/phosphodiesterase n=1 Tax=Asticcacaulis sp. EMRT-3 TaxID=3040349 RepID=UPI0024AECD72|nr:EAL domain-containing protein [Asticcacaulis sp. EMRT-3]MDI7776236.1 EAL domain-containing protein [Asticcacaulis sp. EMRT-3]
MTKNPSELKLLAPMALIVIVAVCALVGSLWIWADQADALSRTREQTLVRLGLDQIADNHAQLMTPVTINDDAVKNTAISYNPAWISKNIGRHFHNFLNFETSLILDDTGKVIGAYHNARPTDPREDEKLAARAAGLIDKLRRIHAQRIASGLPSNADSDHIGRLMTFDGQIYIIGASLILPDSTDSALQTAKPFAVVGLHALTSAELLRLSQHYMVPGIHLLKPGETRSKRAASVEYREDGTGHPGGRSLATLSWMPDAPGRTLFMHALGPVLLISLGLGVIAIILLHQTQKAARGLVASEARAKHMALHDGMTGLPNRTLFADRLNQATERLKRQGGHVAVMCIGLDRFKDVNDTLGHLAGDELIRHNAQKISGIIRSCDTLARLGGDEFVIIQTDTDARAAAALAKRVLETLTGKVTLESGQVFSSCSIGVTLLHDGDIEPAEALRQADLALYRAKDLGRGQYAFFEIEMDATIKLRKTLETGLREAIHADDIDVVYQPQVDHFGHIVGIEALCRWTHPTRGPVAPGYFIPLAEECGLMNDLGHLIMRRAMQDAHRWPGLKVAVNVSATQMRCKGFLAGLKELLAETGTRAEQIEIEITEGVLLNDDSTTQIVLRDLRHMGFTISLDDFGTGYSSLGYLSRYPVDKIKIDRSFISNLGVDPEAEAVIRAIIKLAKALNLNVIAEGVETRAQKTILRQAGCNIIQGFLFSRPVAAEAIDEMMRNEGRLTIHDGGAPEAPRARVKLSPRMPN